MPHMKLLFPVATRQERGRAGAVEGLGPLYSCHDSDFEGANKHRL